VAFNSNGSKIATASTDCTSRVFDTMSGNCELCLIGHEEEVSKVSFNP